MHHGVFPCIATSLNTYMLVSSIIFSILYIAYTFHNKSIFFSLYIQNNRFAGLGMVSLVYVESRVWYALPKRMETAHKLHYC